MYVVWNKHQGQTVFNPLSLHLELLCIYYPVSCNLDFGGKLWLRFHSCWDILQPCPMEVSFQWVRPPGVYHIVKGHIAICPHWSPSYPFLILPPSDFPSERCRHSFPYKHALKLLKFILDSNCMLLSLFLVSQYGTPQGFHSLTLENNKYASRS